MLIILAGLIGLGLLAMGILGSIRKNEGCEIPGHVFGVIILLIVIIVSIAMPIAKLGRAAELEAFYYANAENYASSTQMTEDILSISAEKLASLIAIEGSIEKLKHSEQVSARIAEWRNEVVRYNISIKKFRTFDNSFWLGLLYPTLPDELKYIAIGT